MNQHSVLKTFPSALVSSHVEMWGGRYKLLLLVFDSNNNSTLSSCVCSLVTARRRINHFGALQHMLNTRCLNTLDAIN